MADDAGGLTLRRHVHHELRVSALIDETADARTFVFDVPAELETVFAYDAGQFVTIRIRPDGDSGGDDGADDRGGESVSRCYSMSSAPALAEPLAFTVKRVPGGIVSNWLIDRIGVGDLLELMPPAGVFRIRDDMTTDGPAQDSPSRSAADSARGPDRRPIVAFCGGSGVTPVFSIAKQALATGDRPVRVFDANRDQDLIIFADALDELVAEHQGRLVVHHHIDAESGYPSADDIVHFVAGDIDADVYICGPTPFMDLVESALGVAGVPPERISVERFINAGTTASPATTEASDDEIDSTAGAADGMAAMTITITIKRKRHRVDYVAGDTILETARRASLKPPFSCEQGNCATCMALVTTGSATMRANNALTADEVAEGWVLTCQALPVGPEVAVEYDDF